MLLLDDYLHLFSKCLLTCVSSFYSVRALLNLKIYYFLMKLLQSKMYFLQ